MAKKTESEKPGKPGKAAPKVDWQKKGLATGLTRDTYIVAEEMSSKIRDLAYWERLTMREAVEQAFAARIAEYEKQHGPLKPRPAGK